MVHGLGGTSNVFTPQMEVAGRMRSIRPDLPGSGRSPANGALSIQSFVDRIVAAARTLGVERAHFVGHSMGTIVCCHIAEQHPSLVRSLALLGPLLAPSDAARQGLRDRAAKARAEGMAPVADAIVQAATSADTKTNQPVTVALVREFLMRQDAEGLCQVLRGSRGGAAGRCRADQMPDPADHRRRGRGDAAVGGARHGRADGHAADDHPQPLRPLDGLERTREVNAALRELLFRAGVRATRETAMSNVLFTNVRIFEGTGEPPVQRRGAGAGQPYPSGGPRQPHDADRGRHRHRRRRRHPDARHGRGAHAFLLERPAGPRRDPAHADRRAHPVVRAYRQALPRHGLDVVHGGGDRQAAARRRHPQRDRIGPDSRSALPCRQPGDHGARRAGRRDPAASAVSRIQLRRDRQRARGDAQDRAHVPQIRRRHDQAEPVGRVHRRHPGRVHADDRRGDRRRRQGSAHARQAAVGARAFGGVGEAMRPPRH